MVGETVGLLAKKAQTAKTVRNKGKRNGQRARAKRRIVGCLLA